METLLRLLRPGLAIFPGIPTVTQAAYLAARKPDVTRGDGHTRVRYSYVVYTPFQQILQLMLQYTPRSAVLLLVLLGVSHVSSHNLYSCTDHFSLALALFPSRSALRRWLFIFPIRPRSPILPLP